MNQSKSIVWALFIATSLLPFSPLAHAESKILTESLAKTWGDAKALCDHEKKSDLKWRLPKDSEFLTVVLNMSPEQKKLITFGPQEEQNKNGYLLWVQGETDEQTEKLKTASTVVASRADGRGDDGEAFDLVKNISEMEDLLNKTKQHPDAKENPSPQTIKDIEAVMASLKKGLTVFCVPENF